MLLVSPLVVTICLCTRKILAIEGYLCKYIHVHTLNDNSIYVDVYALIHADGFFYILYLIIDGSCLLLCTCMCACGIHVCACIHNMYIHVCDQNVHIYTYNVM